MNKKLIAIISILAVTLLLFFGYKTFLAPEGIEGEKQVTIHVINEKENVDKTFEYKTYHEFLQGLLEEKQEELDITFEESEFGKMITGMLGYVTDINKEYFHISVGNEDAQTGVSEIPLEDNETYTFKLTDI